MSKQQIDEDEYGVEVPLKMQQNKPVRSIHFQSFLGRTKKRQQSPRSWK